MSDIIVVVAKFIAIISRAVYAGWPAALAASIKYKISSNGVIHAITRGRVRRGEENQPIFNTCACYDKINSMIMVKKGKL